MERIWIKTYPAGIPADISIEHLESLVTLFEEACRKYADQVAYISMDREMTYGELDRLSREDPSLKLRHDAESGQMILSCMGELQLEVILERLRAQYGIAPERVADVVAYALNLPSTTTVSSLSATTVPFQMAFIAMLLLYWGRDLNAACSPVQCKPVWPPIQ